MMAKKRARSPPSRSEKPSALKKGVVSLPSLPDDVVIYNILTWLPYKSLGRFQSVCKNWNQAIFNGFIKDVNVRIHKILAAINGIICLYCSSTTSEERFLFICNTATKEASHRIPMPTSQLWHNADSMGLAVFDPYKSPTKYILVHLMQHNESGNEGVSYRLTVFLSDCREWTVCANRFITVAKNPLHTDSKFAKGVLYCIGMDYVLWFDCKNWIFAYMSILKELPLLTRQWTVVCEDRSICARMCETSLDVWMLNHKKVYYKWEQEKVYGVSVEKILHNNAKKLSLFMKTISRPRRRKNMLQPLIKRYLRVPLPFEGDEEVLFRLITRSNTQYDEWLTLKYDFNTRKLDHVFIRR